MLAVEERELEAGGLNHTARKVESDGQTTYTMAST